MLCPADSCRDLQNVGIVVWQRRVPPSVRRNRVAVAEGWVGFSQRADLRIQIVLGGLPTSLAMLGPGPVILAILAFLAVSKV